MPARSDAICGCGIPARQHPRRPVAFQPGALLQLSGDNLSELETNFSKLEVNVGRASGFTASNCKVAVNCGYTATVPVPFMRPPLLVDLMQLSVSLTGSDLHDALATLRKSLISPEMLWRNISTNHCLEYSRLMYLDDPELMQEICIASSGSHPDGMVYSDITNSSGQQFKIGTGVVEIRDTAYSPLEQLGQCYAIAGNIILGQLNHGLPSNQCCVALLSTNGQLYQFGFVTLLDHSFPVLHVTSGIIDCASEDGRHEAAKHLYTYTFRQSCRLQEEQLQQIRRAENACAIKSVSLSPTKYFVKKMESVFPRCPIKIQSLLRQYEIFQRLSDRDVKEAVLPVAVLSGKLDQRSYLKHDSLVFPRLDGNLMGVPGDETIFQIYLTQLKKAFKNLHAAGVVHLDGFPSNIMWLLERDGRVDVRFVELDVASVIDEPLDAGIQTAYREQSLQRYYWPVTTTASAKHDAWFVFIFAAMTIDERLKSHSAAAAGNVTAVNANFRS
eukprot:gene28601-37571_t